MTNSSAKQDRPTVFVKPSSYQPSMAELREQVKINASPEQIAKSLLRQVKIEKEKS